MKSVKLLQLPPGGKLSPKVTDEGAERQAAYFADVPVPLPINPPLYGRTDLP